MDKNGDRHEDAFQLMTNCIDWCAEKNLRVIVDLHILRSHHFNAEEKPLWTIPQRTGKVLQSLARFIKSINKISK